MPILVVDDYGTMINVIRGQLRQLGFVDVDEPKRCRSSHQDGARRYELIFSAWHMAPVTGLDFSSRRGDARLKHTPLIMETGEFESENNRGEKGRREQ